MSKQLKVKLSIIGAALLIFLGWVAVNKLQATKAYNDGDFLHISSNIVFDKKLEKFSSSMFVIQVNFKQNMKTDVTNQEITENAFSTINTISYMKANSQLYGKYAKDIDKKTNKYYKQAISDLIRIGFDEKSILDLAKQVFEKENEYTLEKCTEKEYKDFIEKLMKENT